MMLRIHCLQHWFGLSDLGAEVALFEASYLRDFVGLSGTQRIPDWVSILRFRHLLEVHNLSPKILEVINAQLSAQGLLLKTSTMVDATLIAAPSSTKNKDGQRDSEMHQTKKGNQWHMTVGHPRTGTSPCALAKRKQHKHTPWGALAEQVEKLKVSVRAKVEHPFRVIKHQFGHTKVRYRRLKKNTAELMTLFALSNLWMVKKTLLHRAQHECVCKQPEGCDVGETAPETAATDRNRRGRFIWGHIFAYDRCSDCVWTRSLTSSK